MFCYYAYKHFFINKNKFFILFCIGNRPYRRVRAGQQVQSMRFAGFLYELSRQPFQGQRRGPRGNNRRGQKQRPRNGQRHWEDSRGGGAGSSGRG